jgi:hypothetical protein
LWKEREGMNNKELSKDQINKFVKGLIDGDEPRFQLDLDSICHGCICYTGEEPCNTPKPCAR